MIENKRLKDTLEVLNQKLKNDQDSEAIINRVQEENTKLREELNEVHLAHQAEINKINNANSNEITSFRN